MNGKLIDQIVEMEWGMFVSTQNEGGPAQCQNDRVTFEIMRKAQFNVWDQKTLESYLGDLKAAADEGRNPVMEKYAYMMEYTAPVQYAQIADKLPARSQQVRELAKEICDILVLQTEAYGKRYPHLSGQGRPIHSAEDSEFTTSVETYQLGELYTYSVQTLMGLRERILALQAEGKNFAELVLAHTVACYGYTSLEQAEASVKEQAEKNVRLVPNFGCPSCGGN